MQLSVSAPDTAALACGLSKATPAYLGPRWAPLRGYRPRGGLRNYSSHFIFTPILACQHPKSHIDCVRSLACQRTLCNKARCLRSVECLSIKTRSVLEQPPSPLLQKDEKLTNDRLLMTYTQALQQCRPRLSPFTCLIGSKNCSISAVGFLLFFGRESLWSSELISMTLTSLYMPFSSVSGGWLVPK